MNLDATPDLFPSERYGTERPHLAAAKRLCAAMLRAQHGQTKRVLRRQMVEHLKALTGSGR